MIITGARAQLNNSVKSRDKLIWYEGKSVLSATGRPDCPLMGEETGERTKRRCVGARMVFPLVSRSLGHIQRMQWPQESTNPRYRRSLPALRLFLVEYYLV